MRRFVFGFVFLCGICYLFAFAEIPLQVKTTLQMPSSIYWWNAELFDIQHYQDDISYGYAYILGNTIFWSDRQTEPVHSFVVQDTLFADYGNEGPWHQNVKLLHLSARGDHTCLLLQSAKRENDMVAAYTDHIYFCLFDLVDQECLGTQWIMGSSDDHWGPATRHTDCIIKYITAWPPPPQTPFLLVFASQIRSEGYIPGGHWWTVVDGDIYHSWLSFSPFTISGTALGQYVAPFTDYDSAKFTVTGYRNNWEPASWTGNVDFFDNQTFTRDTMCAELSCGQQYHIPQHDADGTNRVLVPGGYAVNALQYNDTLWHNAELINSLFTAKLTREGDEQVLWYLSNKFRVYNGSNGELMDSTTAIVGNFLYFIKRPDQYDEIVTIDANHLVRVYGSAPSAPQNVVCYYSPADSMIQLSWSPVFGASSYYIFSQPFCSETDEEWIGEVAGDTTCLVPISYTRECFRVSAVAQ